MTGKELASTAGIAADTLSRIEKGYRPPEDNTVSKLAAALSYPTEFFYGEDPIDLDEAGVSFRSFSKMSAAEKAAATSAGQLGLQLAAWTEKRFDLPHPDLPDLSYQADPEKAAIEVRQYWQIGERPIGNMIGLLESKGVRVLSLSEDTANVNAFSFWRDGKPYIFLNNFKTAESSIFDCAHELGHLLIHCKGDLRGERLLEREADAFAAAFLMPPNDVSAKMTRPITSANIIAGKGRWKVSAFALLYRLWKMGIVSTEHQYRSLCIDLSKRGYRSGEPIGIEREYSMIWRQVFSSLWAERVTKDDVAKELRLPIDELEGLIANMTGPRQRPAGRMLSQA
jgi:Zn-dependent peptidase ImmA (M78 family)/DNA-binding XRE family transcriptional regulator